MLRTFRYIFIASPLLLIALGLEGRDIEKDAEKELKNLYENKAFIIRHFYIGNHLKFDSEGTLAAKAEFGPWSLYGFFQIENMALKKNKMELKGKRLYWNYNSGNRSINFIRASDRTRIEIELKHPGSSPNVNYAKEVFNKVFLPDIESLHKEVPDYWEKFIMTIYNGKNTNLSKIENKCPAGPFYAPQVISRPDQMLPLYTEFAKKAKIEGIIQLRTTTDIEGNIIIKDIVSPLGVGLDENAIEFFSKWKFSPASCQNQAIEWEGISEISLRIYD